MLHRRILLIAPIVIVLIATAMFLYNLFAPEPAPIVLIDYARSVSIPYDQAEDFLKNREGVQYLWFCDASVDCLFVNDNALRPIALESRTSDFVEFVFVDMSNLKRSVTPSRLNSQWGFSNYPAFVSLQYVENEKEILSVLQWEYHNPIGLDNLREWMKENNIYQGVN